MSKHTPGPWKQHDPDYCPFEIWGALDGPLEDGQIHGEQVCDIIESNDSERNHANALLIAAAPDLLACCEVFQEMLLQNNAPSYSAQMRMVNAAIAKAKGQ